MLLTPTQQLATDPTCHTLVEAGAGAGKTAVLVARYLAILRQHPTYTPAHILTLTFTKHAAGEFERRIAQALHGIIETHPDQKNQATEWLLQLPTAQLKTIHSFCHDILKKWGHLIGIDPGFQILTQETAHWIQVRDHWLASNPTHPSLVAWATQAPLADLTHLLTQWARSTRQPITPRQSQRHQALLHHAGTLFKLIESAYQSHCQQDHLLGFNALQSHALTLVSNPGIAQALATQYPHILIDECQDTDPLQWEIIDHITHFSHTPRVCLFVVGDIKQSIYGFRGAKPHIFEHIKHLMTRPSITGKVVTLTDNFRSHHPLIAYFNDLFPHLFHESPLSDALPITYTPLQSQRGHDGGVYTLLSQDSHDEAHTIATLLQSIEDPEHTVVLARSKRILDGIHTACLQAGVHATLAVQSNQLDHQDTIDLLHLALLLENPHDPTWWAYFLRSPWVNGSIQDVSTLIKQPDFKTRFLDGPHPIASTVRSWMAHKETHGLVAAIRMACTQLPANERSSERWVACDKVLEWMAGWPPMVDATHTLHHAFEEGTDVTLPVAPHTVRLMTIHAAKGLEFKRVILAGMGKECLGRKQGMRTLVTDHDVAIRLPGETDHDEYDTLSHAMAQRQLEEEKRIFYVACTRASECLILSSHGPLPEVGAPFPPAKPRYIDMASLIPLPHPFPPPISSSPQPNAPPTPSLLVAVPPTPRGYHRWSVHDVMACLESERECQLGRHIRWDVPPQRNAQIGAAVHYWLFKQSQGHPISTQWWDDLPVDIKPDVQTHIDRCHDWIPALQQGVAHHPEWPFQLVMGQTIISGRADLIRQMDEVWEVIDFKTGDPDPQKIKPQLMLYALAIQKAYRPTQWPIRATVMSSQTGNQHEWAFEYDTLGAFEKTIYQNVSRYHHPTSS